MKQEDLFAAQAAKDIEEIERNMRSVINYNARIDQLHSEIAELRAQNENLSVRNDMWRKKYEILLKSYCEMDVQTDTEECDCTDNCPCKEEG
jgi:uncharacterized membrane protein